MPGTVLVVEDDPKTAELVRLYLFRDGYKTLVAADGLTGLRLARESHPDLVVLDLMLPGMDGLEVCRTLRQESEIPIIMLTARVEEQDRLAGLDLGADDYITKPFSPRELAARVRAVLRRTAVEKLETGPAEIVRGKVRLDLRRKEAFVEGKRVPLTPTELRLLALLMKEPGAVFSREHIIRRVFDPEYEGFDRTVDAHIYNLRRKLEQDPDRPRYIITVYGSGYKFGHV
ncbi:MAG: response regulator transcription factor [Chloroflexi bacterium]|nr:response regulator transcription factor [Chloroflexota bacterium]